MPTGNEKPALLLLWSGLLVSPVLLAILAAGALPAG
jgi:hypothetical protein